MEQKEQLNKIDDMSGETNPYKELIVNNAEKIEPLVTQMEQCSILSNMFKLHTTLETPYDQSYFEHNVSK